MACPRVQLSSEKYFQHTAESKLVKRYKNRVALRALIAFFIGLALIPFAAYVGEHVPEITAAIDSGLREVSGGKYQLPRIDMPQITLPEIKLSEIKLPQLSFFKS